MENKIQTALVSAMKEKNQHNLIALREIKTYDPKFVSTYAKSKLA
jgi:hypothetical protein